MSVCVYVCMCVCLHVCMAVFMSLCLYIGIPACVLCTCLHVCMTYVCLCVLLFFYMSVCISVCLHVCLNNVYLYVCFLDVVSWRPAFPFWLCCVWSLSLFYTFWYVTLCSVFNFKSVFCTFIIHFYIKSVLMCLIL